MARKSARVSSGAWRAAPTSVMNGANRSGLTAIGWFATASRIRAATSVSGRLAWRALRGVARQVARGVFEAGERAPVDERLQLRGYLFGAFERGLFGRCGNHDEIAHIGRADIGAQPRVERLRLRRHGLSARGSQTVAMQHERRARGDHQCSERPAQRGARVGRTREHAPTRDTSRIATCSPPRRCGGA